VSAILRPDEGEEELGIERRGAPRRDTLVGARIVSLNGLSTFTCVIRNLSETGALLVLATTAGVPDKFYLAPPTHDRTILCRVAWRDTKRMGVEFLSAPGDILASQAEGEFTFRPPL
jgi:hypothetical protein